MEALHLGALERTINQVSTFFGRLSPSQKLLIASAAIIGVLAWLVVAQYSSRGSTATLSVGGTPEEMGQRVAALQTAGIDAQITPAGITVPRGRQQEAMARLGEAKLLPADTQYLFRQLIDGQTWWSSREQNNRQYLLALRNELARQIGQYAGVRSAVVNLDVPDVQGMGAPSRRPTASVSVQTKDGSALPQGTVDAVAAHIAGAVAGMEIDRVQVIDASGGRPRKPSAKNELLSTTYVDHASKVEQQTKEKIAELLSYIPGVGILVTAQVDVTQVTARVEKNMDKGQGTVALPKRVTSQSTNQTDRAAGGEPGLRSNTGADIARGGQAPGANLEQSQEENEFENHVGTRTESIVDPRGMPTRLAVSVNIPRGYIVSLLEREKAGAAPAGTATPPAGGAAAPTEAEVTKKFDDEKARIVASLTPHVRTAGSQGQAIDGDVVVSMIAADMPAVVGGAAPGGLLGTIGLGGGGFSLGGGVLDTAVLGLLAAVALFMMISMVKKSARKVDLPTAEELVGVPPQIEIKGESIGEAAEGEMAMSGIEVDDQEMKLQKMLESVSEMVQQDPESAARMLNRWVQVEQ